MQRGSVLDIPVQSGDPLTPNIGATADAKRIPIAEASVIMKIPALPISYADAKPLLAALGGQVVPRPWRGALPITYHAGPGPARVHLSLQSDWSLKPLYDVIAVMRGSERPDEWVIRANHRDGWVFGAWDPLAGQTALLEEARSIGALAKTGWRPRRTIVYASWDGEEPGLLGSTEWAETHADELKAKAVLYVNTDENTRGLLAAQASYSTERLIDQAAADVKDPETGASVRDRAIAGLEVRGVAEGASADDQRLAKAAAAPGADLPIGPMGSGSDYTPFVQHLGVASINFTYGGEGEQTGVYHSQYDTFEHYTRFGDPGLRYGVVMAETGGRLVLRAADADVAPFQFGDLAANIADNLEELHKLVATMRERSAAVDRLLDQNAFALAADPTKAGAPPPRDDAVPALDFGPLDAAVARLKTSAAAYDAALAAAASPPPDAAKLDTVLIGVEHALTDPQGLPGRPWYQHLIYAPGMLTGYGAKTLPGVREAIEGRRWAEAAEFIGRTAKAIDAASDQINAAAALLKPR